MLIIPLIVPAPHRVSGDGGVISFPAFLFGVVVTMVVLGIIAFVGMIVVDWVSDAPKSETLLQFTVRRFRAIGTYFKRIV